MVLRLLYFPIGIILGKALYNVYYFFLVKRYLEKYQNYVKSKKGWYIRENRQKIIKVLENAGIEDVTQPHVEPMGWGFVSTAGFSVFKNLSTLRTDIVPIILGGLREAVSVYKSRIQESFNPVFWFETFAFLPRIMLRYLGLSSDGIVVKLAQFVWWVLVFLSTVTSIFFNKEFTDWVRSIL